MLCTSGDAETLNSQWSLSNFHHFENDIGREYDSFGYFPNRLKSFKMFG